MDPQHPDVPAQPDLDPADPVGLVDPIDPGAAGAEEEDRAGSLTALAGLSSSRLSLEDLLTRVATFAVQAISGADGAGLTLLEADRADTVVKSAPFVTVIDDIQYGIGEGPWPSKTTGNFTPGNGFRSPANTPTKIDEQGSAHGRPGDPVSR